VDIGAAVTRKIGPLPAWAYGVIIVIGVYAYYYFTGKSTSSGTSAPTTDTADYGATDGSVPLGDEGSGSSVVGGSGTAATSGTDTPTDNASWLARSVSYLVGFNYDALTVSNALTKYLTGDPLTFSEKALVAQAIARFGVPPEGAPVSTTTGGTTGGGTTIPGGFPRDGMPAPVRRKVVLPAIVTRR